MPCSGYFEMLQIPGLHPGFSESKSVGWGLENCVFEPAPQVKLKLVALEVFSDLGFGTTELVSFCPIFNSLDK